MKPQTALLLCIPIALGLSSCQTTSKSKSPTHTGFLTSYHGFSKGEKRNGDLVYKGKMDKLRSYKKVYIDVSIRGEVKEHRNIKDRIKGANQQDANLLAAEFENALKGALGSTFRLVNRPERGSLTVRAAVTDMQPNTPIVFAGGYSPVSFVAGTAIWAVKGQYPGSGTVKMQAEVIDSVTKERFFAIIDEDRTGKNEVISGLSRWGRAKKAFRKWSGQIHDTILGTRPG